MAALFAWKERIIILTRKTKFLLSHPKIYDIYALFKVFLYKAEGIGKSGNCRMCGYCKNKGCMKNRIAKKFKLARSLEAKCFEYNNKATTEQ